VTAGGALLKSIDVCVRYSDADQDAAEGDPHELRLAVYDEIEGGWDVLSTDLDRRTRTICARVDHVSDFAIVAGPVSSGFFTADWWTVWWHIAAFVGGAVIVVAIVLWLRYRYWSYY